jgi:hypothetical protein
MRTGRTPPWRAAAVAALAAAALLPAGRAAAALATYRWQESNGATVGGLTTNWAATCGQQPQITQQLVTTMNKAGSFACTADRLTDTAAAGANMLLLVSDTAYAAATRVTGQATGSTWSLQNSSGTGTVVFRFQLGYASGGAFTPFAGQVDVTATNSQASYTPNLSSLSGTVPAGASLALRISLPQTGGSARIYFAGSGSGGGTLQVDEAAATAATLTIGDGTAPAGGTICPADATVRDLAAFTVVTSPAGVTDTVTSVTVDFTNAGANPGASGAIGSASITDAVGTTTYATVASPADAATFTFAAPSLAATSNAATYRIRFTPGSQTMPAGSWNVTAVVRGAAHANAANALALASSPAGSATFAVDNQPPAAVSALAAVPGNGQVQLGWTNPTADFGGYTVVVRAAGSFSGAPAEGTASYAAGAPIGNGTVVCQGNIASCLASALANGTAYTFAVFARDACSNWSPAATVSATPATSSVATGVPGAAANACNSVTVTAPFTGDANNNATIAVARDTSPTGAFATVVCPAGSGGTANPRTCVDGTTVASSSYYYRVTFSDPDGVTGANPQTTALLTTPVCAAGLVLAAPGPQPAGAIAVGGAAVRVGQVTLSASRGTLALASLAVANAAAAPAAAPGTDIQALTLRDASGNVLAVSRWNGARYVFTSPADPATRQALQIGTAAVTLDVYAAAAYGGAAGRGFAMSVSAADVVAAPVAGASSVSPTTGGPVAGSTFTLAAPAAVAEGDRTPSSTRPGVAVFNPGKGTVVSGSFLAQVLVSSPTVNGAADVTAVGLSTSGSAQTPCAATPGLAPNPNYDGKVGTNAAIWQKVLTFGAGGDIPVEGTYTLVACAANASGSVSSAPVTITVRKAGTGDGNLLVRDNSSQLCQDCHAVQTHSSGNTSNKYGSWTVNCRDCHDPHKTRNLFLIREQITPPAASGTYQPAQSVFFANRNGDSSAVGPGGGAAAPGSSSYVNADGSGPCQVCHTRTSSGDGTKARWRNAGAGGNADVHNVGLNDTSGSGGCTGCHSHSNGFRGGESQGGAACSSCHGAIWAAMTSATSASRHALAAGGDSPTDNGTAWNTATTLASVAPAQRSCVSMCHGDHPHNLTSPAGTTHEYNLLADPSTAATRQSGSATRTATNRTSVDFDPVARSGACTRCHDKPVDAARPAVTAAGFGASAHNFTSTAAPAATWEYALHDGSKVQRNCTKCHASRAEGTTPSFAGSAFGAVHGSSDPSLLAGTKSPASTANTTPPAGYVCYNCHGNGTTAGKNLSGKDVFTATQAAFFHPVNLDAKHDSAAEASATWNGGAFSGANRHANCEDCHDPHGAKAGRVNRSAVADANRNLLPPALSGATGVQFTNYPALPGTACSGTPTLPNACFTTTSAASFSASPVPAAKEYEVCFKCHSSFAFGNTAYPTASATGASGLAETDVAAEFSPNNRSGHPVVATLNAYAGNGTANKGLVAAQLLPPWDTNPGNQTMLCTDCHNTDAGSTAAQGPHGSAVRFFLAGANRAWPYTAAGATSGTLRTLSQGTSTNSEAGLGTANGLFCRNCHPQQSTTSGTATNAFHRWAVGVAGNDSRHTSSLWTCVGCHLRVPHGGKVSRLIVTQNAPARYKVLGTTTMTVFAKKAKESYTGWNDFGRSCGEHGSGLASGEAW